MSGWDDSVPILSFSLFVFFIHHFLQFSSSQKEMRTSIIMRRCLIFRCALWCGVQIYKDKKANSKRLRMGHGGCHVSGYVTSICTDSLLTFPSPSPLLLSSLVHLPTLLGHFMPFLSSVLEWAGLIFEEMGHTWSVSDRARTSAIFAFQ